MFFALLNPSAFSSMNRDIRQQAKRDKEGDGYALQARQALLSRCHAFWNQHFA